MQLLVNLDVPDLDAAARLYIEVFGLRAGRRLGPSALELLGAGVPIYLLQQPAGRAAAAHPPRDYARHWTPIHLDVVVEDLEATLARALACGFRADDLPPDQARDPTLALDTIRRADWGDLVRICDPYGHGWCLLRFSAAGYDAIADRP
ncbi:MAG TPA: VOC family protein [Stenotrophomonas sp.]